MSTWSVAGPHTRTRPRPAPRVQEGPWPRRRTSPDGSAACPPACPPPPAPQIGTVPAAISSYLALQAFKPDLIVSAGTAGGFKAQVSRGWLARPRSAAPATPTTDARNATQRNAAHGRRFAMHACCDPVRCGRSSSNDAWPAASELRVVKELPASRAQGAAIGDVFISSAKMNHDRRIGLPGFDKSGLGHITSPPTPNLQVGDVSSAVCASCVGGPCRRVPAAPSDAPPGPACSLPARQPWG